MTQVVVRPYEPEDYYSVNAQEYEKIRISDQEAEMASTVHKYAGPSYTICTEEGKIIACCGLHRMWEGTAEVWGLFSPLMKKYPMAWFAVKRLVKYHSERCHRLQATARCDWPGAMRFIEHLGFKLEGRLEAYGPCGADSMMYALVGRS